MTRVADPAGMAAIHADLMQVRTALSAMVECVREVRAPKPLRRLAAELQADPLAAKRRQGDALLLALDALGIEA